MVERTPSAIGLFAMVSVYWGGLFYWLRGDLLDGAEDEQMRAIRMLLVSFPYVGFVIWGTMSDLPENIREMPYVGRAFKPVDLAYFRDTSRILGVD